MNDVEMLEFVANTINGAKAYESALTLQTDAISFNAALLLIGLDPAAASHRSSNSIRNHRAAIPWRSS